MGSLCSKSSNEPSSDNFSSPGRIVGSVPSAAPSNQRAQIPRTTTGGRTLGGSGGSGGAAADDARSAAAKAAEATEANPLSLSQQRATQRQNTSRGGGKLAQNLAAQRARTGTGTLEDASREERRRREVDGARGDRAWD
ncbi:MAG: hypothetical protein LQ351_004974 [Letrouitia transgressa]|nr:MAG: hypothetical protein LQ351_004974 [Letrouitia transgressa]